MQNYASLTLEMLCYYKGTTEYLTCYIPLIARIRPMKSATLSASPSVTNTSAQFHRTQATRRIEQVKYSLVPL